jgi:chorismate synthase
MNSFGRLFKVQIFGESHGKGVGVVIDGCPAGISLSESDLESDLLRRRSGAKGTTPRKEPDLPAFISGIFNGKTTGAPLTIFFENTNTRSGDYADFVASPRPGHADFTGKVKFGGYNDYRGGGIFRHALPLE